MAPVRHAGEIHRHFAMLSLLIDVESARSGCTVSRSWINREKPLLPPLLGSMHANRCDTESPAFEPLDP